MAASVKVRACLRTAGPAFCAAALNTDDDMACSAGTSCSNKKVHCRVKRKREKHEKIAAQGQLERMAACQYNSKLDMSSAGQSNSEQGDARQPKLKDGEAWRSKIFTAVTSRGQAIQSNRLRLFV